MDDDLFRPDPMTRNDRLCLMAACAISGGVSALLVTVIWRAVFG